MKYISILISFIFIISCQGMVSQLGQLSEHSTTTYQEKSPADLEPISKMAIDITEMAKTGLLPIVPCVKLDIKRIKIENIKDYDGFVQRNVVITDAALQTDGLYTQRMVSEAVDVLGRIDIRDDQVIFAVRDADDREIAAQAKTILSAEQTLAAKGMSPQQSNAYAKVIAEYQKSNALSPDGKFGIKTAESLAAQIPIIEIQKMSSEIVYPARPRHAVYVVPLSIVLQASDKFYKGFESLEKVKEHALSPEEFARCAEKGAQFIVFIYFFDRVDPVKPVMVRISEYEKKATGTAGEKWYAVQGKWPVVVETLSLDKVPGNSSSSSLYANVFIKDKYLNRCIGVHKIK